MMKFWELESIGVLANKASVHDKFLDTIHKRGGHYEVSLPWKEHHPLLPDNYEVAVSCLNSVLKRLRRNPELLAEYNRIIEEQSSKGIILKLILTLKSRLVASTTSHTIQLYAKISRRLRYESYTMHQPSLLACPSTNVYMQAHLYSLTYLTSSCVSDTIALPCQLT